MRLILLLFLVYSLNSFSQVTVSLGVKTGAGSTNVLLSTSTTINRYSRTISIYTASEIFTAGGIPGLISSLAWDKNGTGEYITADAYIKISLKHVSNTVWGTAPVPDWNTEIVGATDVFTSTTYSLPTGTGWKTVNFTTPFLWNGVDNIAVFVEWDRSSTPSSDISWGRSTETNANATRVGSSSLTALVMLVNSNRPLLQFTITNAFTITSLTVSTLGSVPAVINTYGGSLQMTSTILPSGAFQGVTWSIVPGTGSATISTTGLVTAQTNGNVWAKAVSVQDTSMKDSMEIIISNQNITGISVQTQGSVPPIINIYGGTLQMTSTILPSAANQAVTWSLVPSTTAATISTSGLITAQSNGIFWAKAVSVQDTSMMDSLEITVTNQVIPITGISVATQGSVPAEISVKAGSLQLVSTILPSTANQDVNWSIVPGTGNATISITGLVMAQSDGKVWAKAVSVQDGSKMDSLEISISNQNVGIDETRNQIDFKLYPNPVVSQSIFVDLNMSHITENMELRIIDVNGRLLKFETIKSSNQTIQIDDLPSGMYILKLTAGNQHGQHYFIVE